MIHVFSLLYEFILISSPLYVHTYVPTYIHMCIYLFFLPSLPLLPAQSLRFWAPFPILSEKGKLVWTGTEERRAVAVLALHGLERFPSVFWISSSFIIAYERHGQHQPLPGTLPGSYRPSFSSTPCPCNPPHTHTVGSASGQLVTLITNDLPTNIYYMKVIWLTFDLVCVRSFPGLL